MTDQVIIGVGGNLPTAEYGPPRAICGAALEVLESTGDIRITGRSRWYETAPVPISDQPWFVNGAVSLATDLGPRALMDRLLEVEARFGRLRSVRNAARTLDLDILVFGGRVEDGDPILPHPRLAGRAFALLPIRDLVPDWRHPVTGATMAEMLAGLPKDQEIRPLADAAGFMGTEWRVVA